MKTKGAAPSRSTTSHVPVPSITRGRPAGPECGVLAVRVPTVATVWTSLMDMNVRRIRDFTKCGSFRIYIYILLFLFLLS